MRHRIPQAFLALHTCSPPPALICKRSVDFDKSECPLWVISGHWRAEMSALAPKADMFSVELDVCFVPIADILA
jgi:hypothetical protein